MYSRHVNTPVSAMVLHMSLLLHKLQNKQWYNQAHRVYECFQLAIKMEFRTKNIELVSIFLQF